MIDPATTKNVKDTIFKPKSGEINTFLETIFSNSPPNSNFIIFIRGHGSSKSENFGIYNENRKLIVFKPEEITTPVIKAKQKGHKIYGIFEMCYGGLNKKLMNCFTVSIGTVKKTMSNPIWSEDIVKTFMKNETDESIHDSFITILYPEYCKMGNTLSDAWGVSDIDENVWVIHS